jgi:hypothetical protein
MAAATLAVLKKIVHCLQKTLKAPMGQLRYVKHLTSTYAFVLWLMHPVLSELTDSAFVYPHFVTKHAEGMLT